MESNGDVAEDDTGNGIGFALGSWRHAKQLSRANERTNVLVCGLILMRHATGSLRPNT